MISSNLSLPKLETGYVIWDFKGEQLHKGTLERFKQLVWRPRPRSLLSRETHRKIRKNLREYSKQFEEEDQLEASNVSAELVAHRRRLLDEWDSWRRRAKLDRAADAAALGKATLPATLNAPEDPAESQQIEEWIEEVIEETETLV
jgi:translation initiation factor 3 subunit B